MNSKNMVLGQIWNLVYAATGNANDAYDPKVWAQESLMILENSMVATNLVHRDFQDEIKNFGNTVSTRRPSNFEVKKKTDDDDVTDQAAISTEVEVKLDQWLHTTFVIKDGEMSKSFKDLAAIYLVPAALSLGQGADEIVNLQVYQFLANLAGKQGTDPTLPTLISLKEKMTNNKCPLAGRNLIVNPNLEGALLGITGFMDADKIGDDGTALKEGSLGRKLGFNIWMDQNSPSIEQAPVAAGDINNGAGYPKGTTALTIHGGAAPTAGQWILIAGDMTPQRVVSGAGGPPFTSIVISPGLRNAVVDGAIIYTFEKGDVGAGTYLSGWTKPVVTATFATGPAKGQMISNYTAEPTKVYGVMSTPTTILSQLDRALEATWTTNDDLYLGPQGNYGFAFHKNAVAFVSRPLALPPTATGVRAAYANYHNLSIRVTMTYDGKAQGLRVTLDILCGVKVLDANLGAVLLG